MSLVDEEIQRFHEKLSDEGVYAAMYDAQYNAEWHRFRHILGVVDAAMETAGLMIDTRRQIIQHTLAGSPNEGDAIQRIKEFNEKVKELESRPPVPLSPWPNSISPPFPWR
jgi:hypothetical protein